MIPIGSYPASDFRGDEVIESILVNNDASPTDLLGVHVVKVVGAADIVVHDSGCIPNLYAEFVCAASAL